MEALRKRMMAIAKATTPHPKLVLGETMHMSVKHMMSASCDDECGDIRGILRQIAADEQSCGIYDIDMSQKAVEAVKNDEPDTLPGINNEYDDAAALTSAALGEAQDSLEELDDR